jgi:nucleoid-associated protein YgaU
MNFFSHWRMALRSGTLVSLIVLCTATSFAQSLGDIARQERERQKEQTPRTTYVYTNDDLKKDHILVPEDQARVLAARRNASTPAVEASQNPAPASPVASSASSIASVSVLPNISAQAIPDSDTRASASVGAIMPTPVTLEIPREAAPAHLPSTYISRQVSTGTHLQTQLSKQPVIGIGPSDSWLSSTTGKKSVRPRVATTFVTRSDSPELQPRAVVREREPLDSGIGDVVTVEPGDSLWKLAKRYLGRGSRWRELAQLNPQISDANVIHADEWIYIPGREIQATRLTIPRAHASWSASQTRVGAPVSPPSPSFTAQISDHRRVAEP